MKTMTQKSAKKIVKDKPYRVRFDFNELIKNVRSEPNAEEVEGKIKSKEMYLFEFVEYLYESLKKIQGIGVRKIEIALDADPDDSTAEAQLIYLQKQLETNFLKSLIAEGKILSVSFHTKIMGSPNLRDYDPPWKLNSVCIECDIQKFKMHLKKYIQSGKKIRSRPTYDKNEGTLFFLDRSTSFHKPLRKKFFEALWNDRRVVRNSERGRRLFKNGFIVHLDILSEMLELPKTKETNRTLVQMGRDLNKKFGRVKMPLKVYKTKNGFRLIATDA
jgi:hypothetical protein